jgi:hypothetical protein
MYLFLYKKGKFDSVGNFVTAKASDFNKEQQLSTNGLQQVQYQSVRNNKFSTSFNKDWNLVRDQGVGGSNPLSPTIIFNNLQSISGSPPSLL